MLEARRRTFRRGTRIRVLVVDDSVVVRTLVARVLATDQDLEVVGTAAHGAIALAKIPQVNPDVITLDMEMPEMDGLTTLRAIRGQFPNLCVVMFSTLTEYGAASTLEALSLGADDYVTKPNGKGALDLTVAALREELIPKIKQFFVPGTDRVPAPKPLPVPSQPPRKLSPPTGRCGVLAIGVSTGGPMALSALMPVFPQNFTVPILIVQHMPPLFTRLLADRLQNGTRLCVREAADGTVVEAGNVLIAPGDYHMCVRRDGEVVRIALNQSVRQNSCRPSVDALFESVAAVYGSAAVGVVLTGMGQDGLRGAGLLKHQGARIIAQDEASSVVWGMPGAVVKADLADAVVPLHEVVPEILRHVGVPTGVELKGRP